MAMHTYFYYIGCMLWYKALKNQVHDDILEIKSGTNTRANTVKIAMKGLIVTLTGHFVHDSEMETCRWIVWGVINQTVSDQASKLRGGGWVAGWWGGGGGAGRWVVTIPTPKRGHNVLNECYMNSTWIQNSDNKVMDAWSPINPLCLVDPGIRLPLRCNLNL